MTLIEVLVVLFVLGVLAAMLLPALGKAGSSRRIQCVSNLKQISLALRMWANDHDNHWPWQIPIAQGGTQETLATGKAFHHFQAISNELNTPKVLACYSDASRTKAIYWKELQDPKHLSYFVGVDADETRPQTILSGDRSISPTGQFVSGIFSWPSNAPVRWAVGMHGRSGNVAFSDGSVQQHFSDAHLRSARKKDTNAVVRLVMP